MASCDAKPTIGHWKWKFLFWHIYFPALFND